MISESRRGAARRIAASATNFQVEQDAILVRSLSQSDHWYRVTADACECKLFERVQPEKCHHILALELLAHGEFQMPLPTRPITVEAWAVLGAVKGALIYWMDTGRMDEAIKQNPGAMGFEPLIKMAVRKSPDEAREWARSETIFPIGQ